MMKRLLGTFLLWTFTDGYYQDTRPIFRQHHMSYFEPVQGGIINSGSLYVRTSKMNGSQTNIRRGILLHSILSNRDDIQEQSNFNLQSSETSPVLLKGDNDNNTNFWGNNRTKEEIRRHCARILFPDVEYIRARQRIEVISAELPLITIDDFLSIDMCNDIIQTVKDSNKIIRSRMGVAQKLSSGRTSSTIWVHENECEVPLRVLAGRVSRLLGLGASHMENLQVVRYEEGQQFETHTDHLDAYNELDCKGRLATCLVYLNSSSEGNMGIGQIGESTFDGGSTYFPEYDAHVIPKCGKAVFWFNTIEKPGSIGYTKDMKLNVDLRSRHSGEAVHNGVKWVCNQWVHPVPQHNDVRDDIGLDLDKSF